MANGMKKIIRIASWAAVCAIIAAAAFFITGSMVFSAAALPVSLILLAYNSISSNDTLPDSDYLSSGEGLSAAAGIYAAATLFNSSLTACALSAAAFSLFHLFILKKIINPSSSSKEEIIPAGIILAAIIWIASVALIRNPEGAASALTGIIPANAYSLPLIAAAAIIGLSLNGAVIILKPELSLIQNGCAPMLLSKKWITLAEIISIAVRSLSAAGIVLFGGILLSFGYSVRRSGLASGAVESFIFFLSLTQIIFLLKISGADGFFMAASAGLLSIAAHIFLSKRYRGRIS